MDDDEVSMDVDLLKIATGQFDLSTVSSLSLGDLGLRRIQNLDELECLTSLNLSRNKLSRIEGLGPVAPRLVHLDLSYNRLAQLDGLGTLPKLRALRLQGNQVADPQQLAHLANCPSLRAIHFQEHDGSHANPVCTTDGYRQQMGIHVRNMACLDGKYWLKDMLDASEVTKLTDGKVSEIVLPESKPWTSADFWDGALAQESKPVVLPSEAKFKAAMFECKKKMTEADEIIVKLMEKSC
eukprot:TRINITY_DN332_c0_g1_i1.p1 TRINITY_DN332_c0_g1~~TRINITY_DN332_c0_g1_i1.p1  ORF type:complete len:239 (+),score=25.03 TRINITY_DN332_c0_g1_i1:52-768(+)